MTAAAAFFDLRSGGRHATAITILQREK